MIGAVAALANAEIAQASTLDARDLANLAALPTEERELCRIISQYAEQAMNAGGGGASWSVLTRLRAERMAALQAFAARPQLRGWVGVADETYEKPDSTSVMIQLPCRARLATGTIRRDATPADAGTSVFGAIGNLAPGQRVVFSGVFKVGPDQQLSFYNVTDAGRLVTPRMQIDLVEIHAVDGPSPPVPLSPPPPQGGGRPP